MRQRQPLGVLLTRPRCRCRTTRATHRNHRPTHRRAHLPPTEPGHPGDRRLKEKQRPKRRRRPSKLEQTLRRERIGRQTRGRSEPARAVSKAVKAPDPSAHHGARISRPLRRKGKGPSGARIPRPSGPSEHLSRQRGPAPPRVQPAPSSQRKVQLVTRPRPPTAGTETPVQGRNSARIPRLRLPRVRMDPRGARIPRPMGIRVQDRDHQRGARTLP